LTSLIALALQSTQAGGAQGSDEVLGLSGQEIDFWSYTINMVFALALVIGLILAIGWVARVFLGRRLALGSAGLMQIVASVPLGDRRYISVVRVGGRYFLVGVTAQQITLLSDVESEQVAKYVDSGSDSKTEEGRFASFLKRLTGRTDE